MAEVASRSGRESASRPEPQDRTIDRREFLERSSRLTAAAAVGMRVEPEAGLTSPRGSLSTAILPRPTDIQATRPWEMTVAEVAALIRSGSLSPVEVVEGYLARIAELDPVLEAFNLVAAESAKAAAREAESASWSGPLHGIPVAVKDNYYTKGVLTTANSHIFADFIPEFDATGWARLREGGAILLGKTQMGPLATSRATTPDGTPTTANAWAPFDEDVSPGGSSSGSATAVAGRLAASSTGTQTGGSITNPAGRQGLTGLKPTMGRVSLHGIIPLTYTRDHAGPLARDARDAAILLQAMAGPDPLDPRTLGLPPVPDYGVAADPVMDGSAARLRWPTTIGVVPGYLDVELVEGRGRRFRREPEDPAEREQELRIARERREAEGAARRAMLESLESLGARIVEIDLPPDWQALTSSELNNVRLPERAEPFLHHLRRDVRSFGVSLSPWIHGLLLSGPEYLRGQRSKLLLLRRVLEHTFTRCDVVVQTSPIPFDMIGLPLVTFPIGFEDSRGVRLPLAGLLGGLPFGEERLLSVVAGYQAVTSWHGMRPSDPDPTDGRAGALRRPLDILDVLEDCE